MHRSLLTWLCHWALWIAFVSSTSTREIVVGAVVSALTTMAAARFSRRSKDPFKLCVKHLKQIIHVPKLIVSDTGILLKVIGLSLVGKKALSRIVSMPFVIGGNSPSANGRRALAITYLTLTPNSLVFGFLPKRQALFFHALIPQPLPKFIHALEAAPEDDESAP